MEGLRTILEKKVAAIRKKKNRATRSKSLMTIPKAVKNKARWKNDGFEMGLQWVLKVLTSLEGNDTRSERNDNGSKK